MDVGVLDTILDTVATACTGTNIGDYAKSLYAKLIVIDFIVAILFNLMSFGGPGFITLTFTKIMTYGFWLYVIRNWGTIINLILESLTIAGGSIGGGVVNVLTHPSVLLMKGWELSHPVWEWVLDSMTLFSPGKSIALALAGVCVSIAIITAFAIIAYQVFITYLEFYFTGALMLLFIPFGVTKWTERYSDASIRGVLAAGVKLMYLQAVVAVTMGILNNFKTVISGTSIDWSSLLGSALVPWAMAYLAWEAPALGGAFMTGGAALSGQSLSTDIFAASRGTKSIASAGARVAGVGAIVTAAAVAKAAEMFNHDTSNSSGGSTEAAAMRQEKQAATKQNEIFKNNSASQSTDSGKTTTTTSTKITSKPPTDTGQDSDKFGL